MSKWDDPDRTSADLRGFGSEDETSDDVRGYYAHDEEDETRAAPIHKATHEAAPDDGADGQYAHPAARRRGDVGANVPLIILASLSIIGLLAALWSVIAAPAKQAPPLPPETFTKTVTLPPQTVMTTLPVQTDTTTATVTTTVKSAPSPASTHPPARTAPPASSTAPPPASSAASTEPATPTVPAPSSSSSAPSSSPTP